MDSKTITGAVAVVVLAGAAFFGGRKSTEQTGDSKQPANTSQKHFPQNANPVAIPPLPERSVPAVSNRTDQRLVDAINNLAESVKTEGKSTRSAVYALSQGQSTINETIRRATWKPPLAPPAENRGNTDRTRSGSGSESGSNARTQSRLVVNRKLVEEPVTRYVSYSDPAPQRRRTVVVERQPVTARVYSPMHAQWQAEGYTASWDDGPDNPPTYTKTTVGYSAGCGAPYGMQSYQTYSTGCGAPYGSQASYGAFAASCASPSRYYSRNDRYYAPQATFSAPYYRSSWVGPFGLLGGTRTVSGGSINTNRRSQVYNSAQDCGPGG